MLRYERDDVPVWCTSSSPHYRCRSPFLTSSLLSFLPITQAPEDFKEWSTSSAPGSSQWTYPALKPYFEKFERFSEDPNQVFMVNLAHRGREGKIDIGYQGLNGTWQSAWSKGVAAVGIEGVDDLNTPRGTLGYSQVSRF